MTEEFVDQGGAASSSPSGFKRLMGSIVLPRILSSKRRAKRRARYEAARIKAAEPHRIEYFHQVDDPYSYLAAQILDALCQRYQVELVCHLIAGPTGKNLPEPDLLLAYGRMDCEQVAPWYGLEFPRPCSVPDAAVVASAAAILANVPQQQFAAAAVAVGKAQWTGDEAGLAALASSYPAASREETADCIEQGTARQLALKHFSGAMFYYGEEWYWGVDRLYHLEHRLLELGLGNGELLQPRPPVEYGPLRDSGALTLEIYPSLRSPYTAISFDVSLAMAKAAGVKVMLKPVMPMVMRGVSLSREKSAYIVMDTAREEASLGVSGFGRMYDPIGEPVRRAFSLYPWAHAQGRGAQYISAFLQAAFYRGVNTLKDSGHRWVVERAGLSWPEAKLAIDQPGWGGQLEQNREEMYHWGSWGVPSFRLLDANGDTLAQFWGQDRLWVISRIIQRHLQQTATDTTT